MPVKDLKGESMKPQLTLVVAVAAAAVAVLATPVIAGGVANSATGSGHLTADGGYRTFSFSAREYADGSVKGQAQLNNRGQERRIHFTVDCLAVVGNRAYISGMSKSASQPADLGGYWNMAVEDNGQGASSPPDRVTRAFQLTPAPSSQWRCDNPAVQALMTGQLLPVERGNVQVR